MKLELTPAEVNLIGLALGKLPFEQVAPLVIKIRQQCDVQQDAKAAPPPPPGNGRAATEPQVPLPE